MKEFYDQGDASIDLKLKSLVCDKSEMLSDAILDNTLLCYTYYSSVDIVTVYSSVCSGITDIETTLAL